jgi:hypothetical protein
MCKYHGLEKIMGFRYDWNEEVILEFYSTFFFHKYSISIGRLASVIEPPQK